MSQYLKSNIVIPNNQRTFTAEEAETLTPQEFDALSIADQTSLFNDFPNQYARLTGQAADVAIIDAAPTNDTPQESDAERYARIVDEAFLKVLGHIPSDD